MGGAQQGQQQNPYQGSPMLASVDPQVYAGQANYQADQDQWGILMDDLYQRMKARAANDGYDPFNQELGWSDSYVGESFSF